MNHYLQSDHQRYDTGDVREMLQEIIDHLRADIVMAEDAQACALFETAVEVLTGLKGAFEHYEEGGEEAWRR
jgi:hypothetical protein